MSTLIGILTVIVLCFLIARRHKDHRTFVNLLACTLFGFIVGASVKSNFTTTDDNQPKVESIASDSMSHVDSSAVVWTVEPETLEMNSKNNEGDTVQPTKGGDSTNIIKPAIQNDS